MISFLNGFILPALAAASIPIILHFLSKKKARIIPFSSTQFLKIIENQRIKRVKLYQILLILVRTFFIIFLVFSFSRPTITAGSSNFSNAQTTAIIILDDSYSMQAYAYSKTYFEIAREKLSILLSTFNNDDVVFIYTSSMDNPVQFNANDPEKIISSLKVSNSIFDFYKSFAIADSIFKNHVNLNNEIYVLSDFKFSQDHMVPATNGDENYRIFKIPLAEDIPFKNTSIDSVVIIDQLFELNKPLDLTITLTNHDDDEVETNLNLYHSEDRIGMDFISLEGNETKSFNTTFTPKTSGIHNLIFKLDEDDLSLDNSWFFSLKMNSEINVLFISDETSLQLKTALDILEENSSFKFRLAGYNEWLGTNFTLVDLIVLNNFIELNQNSLLQLIKLVKKGKSIVVIPGNLNDLKGYNSFLSALSGQQIEGTLETASGSGFYSIENQKSSNIIFNDLFRDKSTSFKAPKVFKYINLSTRNRSLIQLSNDDTYLNQINNIMIFSSSFNREWTDLEINGLFLPMLHRSFFFATQNAKSFSNTFTVGDEIIFKLENNPVSEIYKIHSPQNKPANVIAEPVANSLLFKGDIAIEPGFYTLTKNDLPISTISVNHSSKELKKPYIDSDAFKREIISLGSETFLEQIQNSRLGMELWFPFLALAFIMIILEIILIKLIEGTPFYKRE